MLRLATYRKQLYSSRRLNGYRTDLIINQHRLAGARVITPVIVCGQTLVPSHSVNFTRCGWSVIFTSVKKAYPPPISSPYNAINQSPKIRKPAIAAMPTCIQQIFALVQRPAKLYSAYNRRYNTKQAWSTYLL